MSEFHTAKTLSDAGIGTIRDLLLFKAFYPAEVDLLRKVEDFGTNAEEFKRLLAALETHLQKSNSISLRTSVGESARLKFLSFTTPVVDSLVKEKLQKSISNRCVSAIIGPKGSCSTLLASTYKPGSHDEPSYRRRRRKKASDRRRLLGGNPRRPDLEQTRGEAQNLYLPDSFRGHSQEH